MDRFVRIEGVDAPGTPVLLSFDEGELLAERKQRLLDPRKDDVAIEETLGDVEIAANGIAVDRCNQGIAGETGVPADVDRRISIRS